MCNKISLGTLVKFSSFLISDWANYSLSDLYKRSDDLKIWRNIYWVGIKHFHAKMTKLVNNKKVKN